MGNDESKKFNDEDINSAKGLNFIDFTSTKLSQQQQQKSIKF